MSDEQNPAPLADVIRTEIAMLRGEVQATSAQRDWDRAECDRRHESANSTRQIAIQNREALIELVGRSGKNGRVSEMTKAIAENRTQTQANTAQIHRLTVRIAAAAAGGGGTVVGLIELLRWLGK